MPHPPQEATSFAETALRLGGKSEDEARRTGAIDQADDQVETLYAPRRQTSDSPLHQAVWGASVPVEAFGPAPATPSAEAQRVMQQSLDVVCQRARQGSLRGDDGKLAEGTLADLAAVGYWGLLVGRELGGSGAPFGQFARFLTHMATLDGATAGLASVHGCIGAVDPVATFGSPEQQRRFLPGLASGERLSAFALTEPGAGTDLTALKTTATRQGDHFVLHGEKLFITNAAPGRTIGLVCLVEGRPAVLVVELPAAESDAFRLRRYGLHALKHTHNQGLVFNGLRVPVENLLTPPRGDGLTVAYHGLNRGRVALAAIAAGTLRGLMAGVAPWARYRVTYGEPIAQRELVRRRLGELAGLTVGCDALTAWGADLLDQGYRGEMECIVAKVFASEALKHAAIELAMKTHGGRAFLVGHPVGDNLHELLAPSIYEGEGEMLSLALFKSLVKEHGKRYYEPIGRALAAAGIDRPQLLNPRHAWTLAPVAAPYVRWRVARRLARGATPQLPGMPRAFRRHAAFACGALRGMALEVDNAMRRFQLRLADRQCRMAELSRRSQDLAAMLVTALYGARQQDETLREAADVMCQVLRRRLAGERPTDAFFRQTTRLGAAVAEGAFPGLSGLEPGEVLMPYER